MALAKSQKSLKDWGKQKWRTSDRSPSKGKKRYLPDAEYNVPTWDNIYDALQAIESIIEFDPTE